MADDGGVLEEAGDVGRGEAGDFGEVESGEGGAEVFAFTEDGEPGEAGLESFEADFFEEADVVGVFPPPLVVVVMLVVGVIGAPPAAGAAVGAEDEAVFRRWLWHG